MRVHGGPLGAHERSRAPGKIDRPVARDRQSGCQSRQAGDARGRRDNRSGCRATKLLGLELAQAKAPARNARVIAAGSELSDASLLRFTKCTSLEETFMGSLFPVGGGPDNEIISTLDKLFSGANFKALVKHRTQTGEDLFDKHHRLSRVAARIGAYPARDYGSDPAKKKWFYFLHKELNKATQDAIKRILGDALKNPKIKALAFSVEDNAAASHPHLFPSNEEPLANYLDTTRAVYLVKMIVKKPLDDSNLEDPPGDNDPDKDSSGTDLEHPITWPSFKGSRRQFAKRRKPRG